jgi:ATP-binding cassette subfamily F protein uup
MNLLTVENLTKSFGEKLLFENISFGIEVGQKVALIARNGAGKSTLIRILAGEEIADEGKITMGNDIINYRNIAFTYNRKVAQEVNAMIG